MSYDRSLSLGACNYPIFLSQRLHRSIYFYFEFIPNSDPHRNLSDQLLSQAQTNVDMSTDVDMFTWGRIVLSLPKRAHVDWNKPISQEKYLKNRLVCKNAVAFAYYGSCRLLVIGSFTWQLTIVLFPAKSIWTGNIAKPIRLMNSDVLFALPYASVMLSNLNAQIIGKK